MDAELGATTPQPFLPTPQARDGYYGDMQQRRGTRGGDARGAYLRSAVEPTAHTHRTLSRTTAPPQQVPDTQHFDIASPDRTNVRTNITPTAVAKRSAPPPLSGHRNRVPDNVVALARLAEQRLVTQQLEVRTAGGDVQPHEAAVKAIEDRFASMQLELRESHSRNTTMEQMLDAVNNDYQAQVDEQRRRHQAEKSHILRTVSIKVAD